MAYEEESVWRKAGPNPGIKRVLPQTGFRKSVTRDLGRSSRLPGKRLSRTGNVYWETRKNRSDLRGQRL